METLLVLLIAAFCTVLPFLIGQRYGVIGLASPMHVLAYFCGFGFLAKAVAYTILPDLAFYPAHTESPWALLAGALYLSCFILLMCFGYLAAARPFPKASAVRANRCVARHFTGLWMLTCLACAVAVLTLGQPLAARGITGVSLDALRALNSAKQIDVNAAGVGATLAGLKTLFILPKLAFAIVFARATVLKEPTTIALALFLAMVLVGIALVSGDRFELVELMLITAATHALFGGHLRRSAVLWGGFGFAVLCAISAYMTALRGSDGALWQQIVGSTYFLDINIAAIVTDRVAPAMYLGGESYGWWTFGWVPRAIWPDKPAIDLGVMLKRDVLGIPTGGAFNVTGPGEAFLNFGWAGVCVGFLLGWIYRKAEVFLLRPVGAMQGARAIYYPLILLPFVQGSLQSSFSAFVVGAVAQAAVILAVLWVWAPRFVPVRRPVQGIAHAS
ncbi:MAG: O-antigen polymerase [Pseudomonadota bacterium]